MIKFEKKLSMKKHLFLIAVLFVALQSFAQDNSKPAAEKKDGPVLTWEKKTHDFGDIYQGDKVEHTFYFTNTGNEPLLITNVQVTCGCTTPKGWPRDPIQPGGKGELSISFNSSGKIGKQTKSVTITSNASNTDASQITFYTNILDKKPQ
jgi:hypothetical protein